VDSKIRLGAELSRTDALNTNAQPDGGVKGRPCLSTTGDLIGLRRRSPRVTGSLILRAQGLLVAEKAEIECMMRFEEKGLASAKRLDQLYLAGTIRFAVGDGRMSEDTKIFEPREVAIR
jgi:hypothetical protein